MKNKFIYILLFYLNFVIAHAESLDIKSEKIKVSKKSNEISLIDNVIVTDAENNTLKTNIANYNKSKDLLKTQGETKITTEKGFEIISKDVIFDNINGVIKSDHETIINDIDGNEIFLSMFNYNRNNNIFFSKGTVKLEDINNNIFEFSQIYLDENKNKIVGSDIKAFFNDESFKDNIDNDPRLFANTLSISETKSEMTKGIFTFCKDRGEDKCPPWSMKASNLSHDNIKKTIYYKNAVLQIYDVPIFYFPRFSHPDPTVKRRSGLLAPILTSNSSVGTGINVPYFFAIGNDRDLTLTPRLYTKENPIVFAEYRQEFRRSSLLLDTSYSQGYKETNDKKTEGSRSHFFSNLFIDFSKGSEFINNLEINTQKVSNPTYFKVHDIETFLVDKNENILENYINYNFTNDKFLINASISAFEDLNKTGDERYEYLFPSIDFQTNLLNSEKLGILDLNTLVDVRNFDGNKQTEFLVNDLNFSSLKNRSKNGLETQLKGLIKGVNYRSKKVSNLKNEDTNNELSGVLSYQGKYDLFKESSTKFEEFTPRFSLRYSPTNDMRQLKSGERLTYSNLYEINKMSEIDVIENGLSLALGFEYNQSKKMSNNILKDKFDISLGQVISANENPSMPSESSLGQRFSDVVGDINFFATDDLEINYNFSLDQNYKELIGNDVVVGFDNDKVNFNIKYLEEKNHIGNKEFTKLGLGFNLNNNNKINFETKRNLISNSADFYNLSYDYINDCLKASLIYRREFYTDRDIEPSNSLMFKISIIPFTSINTPKLGK